MDGRQARSDCALSTDNEFVDDHEHEEDHEEEEEEHSHEHEEEHEEEEHLHEHEEEHEEEHAHENKDEHETEEHAHEGHEHDEHEHDDEHGHDEEEEDEDDDTMHIKIIALVVLFMESIIGSMVPVSVGSFKGFKEVLSLLNCFAGGILMSTGSPFRTGTMFSFSTLPPRDNPSDSTRCRVRG